MTITDHITTTLRITLANILHAFEVFWSWCKSFNDINDSNTLVKSVNVMTSLGWVETAGSVVVLVHAPLSVPGLGAPRPLGHDDLVHPQDCAGGVSGVLQGPLLSQHQIQYVGLQAVLRELVLKAAICPRVNCVSP